MIEYGKSLGLMPVRVKKLGSAKHIFSHVEWHMIGYEILVDELEKNMGGTEESEKADRGEVIFADLKELREKYPIPSAFEAYVPEI